METSPTIKRDIVAEFEKKFKGKEGSPERHHFDQLKKPDICSVIISANETRHHWYLELDPLDPLFFFLIKSIMHFQFL
jgi:hypothetical protein